MTVEHRLEELANRVFRELGFAPTDLLRQRLGRVIRHRMKLVGAADLDAYLDYLETGGRAELTRLVQALTINETYFFREPKHFTALEKLLPELAARYRPVRLLSAGCATGEEAYSLAITACRALGQADGFEVVGVDVDESALSRARDGRYGAWSFREDALSWAKPFLRADGDRWQVTPELRSLVRFDRMNLVESAPSGPFHVIFCRNMLMYLTPENRRTVIERLARELVSYGVLFTGSAETLEWAPPDLKRVRAHGTFFYKKQAGPERPGQETAGRMVLVSQSPLVRMLWRQTADRAGRAPADVVILNDWRHLPRLIGEGLPEIVVVDASASPEAAAAVAAALDQLPTRCRRLMLTRPGHMPNGRHPGLEVVVPGSGSPADLRVWLETFLTGRTGLTPSPASGHRPAERLLLLGCSTGGPPVVVDIMRSLPADLGLAVVIVQHMPAGFTRSFADRLDRVSAYRVQEAAEGAELRADSAFVAPGQRHLLIGRNGLLKVALPEPADLYVPSIDRTFLSAAESPLARRTFAVVLTGMGSDGAAGLRALASAGAETAVQDPAEALIPAMVNAALGSAKYVLKVADIAQVVTAWAQTKSRRGGNL